MFAKIAIMIRTGLFGIPCSNDPVIHALKILPDFELAGIYYPEVSIVPAEHDFQGIPYFRTFGELVERSEVIIFSLREIIDPSYIAYALKNSKHILVDHICRISIDKLDHLFKLAAEANVVLRIRKKEKHNPALRVALDLVRNPFFIEIRKETRLEPDHGSHEGRLLKMLEGIDALLDFRTCNLRKINISEPLGLPGPPEAFHARLEYDNGCIASISANRFAQKEKLICRYYQTGEMITIDLTNHKVQTTRKLPGTGNLKEINHLVPAGDPHGTELLEFMKDLLSQNMQEDHKTLYRPSVLISRKVLHRFRDSAGMLH